MSNKERCKAIRGTIDLTPFSYLLSVLARQVSLAVFALAVGCTVETSQSGEASQAQPNPNRPPVIHTIRIQPDPIVLNKSVSVVVQADDPDRDLITFRHQWKVNGRIIEGATHDTIEPQMLKRGDRVSVDVIPYDGHTAGTTIRAEAMVGNTPPDIKGLLVKPDAPRLGDAIYLDVTGVDADADPIHYRYRWFRNDSEVADGEEDSLATAQFTRGDLIFVEVTPFDETAKGKARVSEPVMIVNSPPVIKSVPPAKIERGQFVYDVLAEDRDGDTLTYALEAAPAGMTIDQKTGRIEWPVSAKTTGPIRVRVTATDPQDAHAYQEFDLTFSSVPTASRLHFSRPAYLQTRLVTQNRALLE